MGAALEGHDVRIDGARVNPAREVDKVLPVGRPRRAAAAQAGVGSVSVAAMERRAPCAARVVDLSRETGDVRGRWSRVLRVALDAAAEGARRLRIVLHPPRDAAATPGAHPVPSLEVAPVATGGRGPAEAAMGDPDGA